MLLVVAGLPGTGKTTLARLVAARLRAAHVRVDAIEAALRRSGHSPASLGATGYIVAEEVTATCLAVGTDVVVDAVCPVPESRRSWREVAARTGTDVTVVELRVDDRAEHRRRIDDRTSDLDGLSVPSWQDVLERHYEPWDTDRDGSRVRIANDAGPERALTRVLDALESQS